MFLQLNVVMVISLSKFISGLTVAISIHMNIHKRMMWVTNLRIIWRDSHMCRPDIPGEQDLSAM